MTAIIIVIVVAAVAVGIAAAIGTGPLVLVILPLGILLAGWLLVMGASRMRTGDVVRRAPRQEFFGPGGPDDPDRA